MAKKNFLTAFKQHLAYSEKALWWAHEAVDLKKRGKVQRAKKAEDKARAWLTKAKKLEPKSGKPS